MTDRIKKNVFYTLFSDVEDIESHLQLIKSTSLEVTEECEAKNRADLAENVNLNVETKVSDDDSALNTNDPVLKRKIVVNNLVEELFAITLNKQSHSLRTGRVTELIHLKELASSLHPENLIDIDILKQALFERLVLEDPIECVIHKIGENDGTISNFTIEKECVTYLFHSYTKIREKLKKSDEDTKKYLLSMIEIIIENVATALKEPALYEECQSQNLAKQLVGLLSNESASPPLICDFLSAVAAEVEKDESDATLFDAFTPVLELIHSDLNEANIFALPRSDFELLKIMATIPSLAKVLLEHSTPKSYVYGAVFSRTLLGAAFNLSCLPKTDGGLYEYFDYPAPPSMETNLWTGLSALAEELHTIFVSLLRSQRHQALHWLGACLDANVHRGHLSALSAAQNTQLFSVSDAFALNLSAVLLRLAKPFALDTERQKLLKIDPTYTSYSIADGEVANKRGVHMTTMGGETCLLPVEDGGQRPLSTGNFSFITECFFMCHRSLDIGLRVVLEQMQDVYKQLVKVQNAMRLSTAHGHSDTFNVLKEKFELIMKRYFCLRCALFEPSTLTLLSEFIGTTSDWLVQIVIDNDDNLERETFAPIRRRPLSFPLPNHIPATLRCVPEMLLEHTASYLVLMKRFSPQNVELVPQPSDGSIKHILSMLLTFMNSNKRARNPHLRARLAECLECLLPLENEVNAVSKFYREQLFTNHPHTDQVVRCLLDVFVGIEMTGESVTFEQKFNYRQPMYAVMNYLWAIPKHRQYFKDLAKEAEDNMNAVTPPLFLRFLNLLMNDAIFLLDEALSNMAQLRTLVTARENGEWESLPDNERERNETALQHAGAAARIDNILGGETIRVLEYLSTEIKSIFSHPTMSDRVAAMLNYFLFHLVGPKMKNFKVKDNKDYKFDPATIVMNICKIYIHLGDSDEFCKAVSRDGRSYNPKLFQLARNVLERIGGSSLISDILTVEEKVQKLAAEQEAEEEILADIPEEFLDPIMSTLMVDPVTLPSSKMNIDRSTISRHILSDQSDPFNRSLLTMNMVVPNTELKDRIQKWKAERMSSILQRKSEEAESAAATASADSMELDNESAVSMEIDEEPAPTSSLD